MQWLTRTRAAGLGFLACLTAVAVVASTRSTAVSQEPAGSTQHPLAGTSWQLIRFQGGDGLVLTPDDRSKYTMALDANGSVAARIDCNRGRGTWMSKGPGNIEFGPLALTRALCPPESLHDRIVRQWNSVRSYLIKDGHLFLGLIADGGVYEFAPLVVR